MKMKNTKKDPSSWADEILHQGGICFLNLQQLLPYISYLFKKDISVVVGLFLIRD